MRSRPYIVALVLACLFVAACISVSWARDYEPRFVRNYPPGYYGMWYYAERFDEKQDPQIVPQETYRWDKYMSRITDVYFPFFPIPYDWDYGTHRRFNLPDDTTNDWH
ncbi:MAG: hypothetical protein RDU20_05085 [Desulfomonilaceae bacterium]|nr:hypothetical protein [Desulfomonilaceae bacterium]